MRTATFGLLLLSVTACAAPQRAPLHLPTPDAPLEHRIAAYGANATTIRASLWRSWRVQVGDEPEDRSFRDARPLLENSPEASRILHERDQQMALGWGLFGGGTAAVLGGALAVPLTLGSAGRDDRSDFLTPLLVSTAGIVLMAVGTLIAGGAETRATQVTETYNRWLWDTLALPRAGRTPHPAPPPPSGLTPWGAPPP